MLKQAAKILIQLLLSSPGVNNRPEDVPSIKEASKNEVSFCYYEGEKGQQTLLYRNSFDCVFQYGVKVSLANFARRYMLV
jgi:hypothetical protein